MEYLRCVIERITYYNEENGYYVIKCRAAGYKELIVAVGCMNEVYVGSVLKLGGNWRIDSKYGKQFSIENYEEMLPATVFGIEKYLGSGLIKGIGPRFAKKITAYFGKDTLSIIEEKPDELLNVPGIGKMRVEQIKKSWIQQKEIKNIMLFLKNHDVSTGHATKIYKQYGNESIDIVNENPYRLADEIRGIGFRTADIIASKMGFEHEKYVRLRSGLIYTLNRLAEDGHCYACRKMLVESGAKMLDVDENLLSMTLDEMIRTKDVITESLGDVKTNGHEEKAIYLPPFYFSETGCVRRLKKISENKENPVCYIDRLLGSDKTEPAILKRLEFLIKEKTNICYDPVQLEAVYMALINKIIILTGGPGTGKTTVTLGIITAFKLAGARILLAAPTGRAAKRLSEATGMEAKTIHRLLEVKPPNGYKKNEENPLSGDVLIIDECSMIDLILMYNLLKAVPDNMNIVFIGDTDQLPSVGAGNVLCDLIDSGSFKVVRLEKIFRQAKNSRIVLNAHRINKGESPDISNGKSSDFFFIEKDIPEEVLKNIVELVSLKLPSYYKVSSGDIQVLTPMQKGVIGAQNLNQALQAAVNPGGAGIKRSGSIYKKHDKVMQIRNNYDKEVYNGDIGIIENIDFEDKTLEINFDGRRVEYDVSELDEIVLAYAATIHKAQGSEYPIVVIPVLMQHYLMLHRNLIYTGITRAKKILIIIGSKNALFYSVANTDVVNRNTLLKKRLCEIKK